MAVPLKDSPNVECLKVKVFRIITDVLGLYHTVSLEAAASVVFVSMVWRPGV